MDINGKIFLAAILFICIGIPVIHGFIVVRKAFMKFPFFCLFIFNSFFLRGIFFYLFYVLYIGMILGFCIGVAYLMEKITGISGEGEGDRYLLKVRNGYDWPNIIV